MKSRFFYFLSMLFLSLFFSCRAGFLDYVRSWFSSNNYGQLRDESVNYVTQDPSLVPKRKKIPVKSKEEEKEEERNSKEALKLSGSEETAFIILGNNLL